MIYQAKKRCFIPKKGSVKKMIVITSGKDCNHYAISFRKVGTIIMIIFQNHCNHFFKQSKLMIFFIEFHSLNVLF